MLTKIQKTEHIEAAKKLVTKHKTLVFADFTAVPTKMIEKLKRDLAGKDASYKVFKKRLLRVAFKDSGYDFDPLQFRSQLGVIAIKGDLFSLAGLIYKFSKDLQREKKEFKILGAYDVSGKIFIPAEQFTMIAKLPTREVLLGQVMGMFTAPLRSFMYLLQQIAKSKETMVESN